MKASRVIRREVCPQCVTEGRDSAEDNLAVYDDGHTYCYGGHGLVTGTQEDFINLSSFTYEYLPLRGINTESLKKYNIKTKIDPTGKPIAVGFTYPFGLTKVRTLDEKEFYWTKEPGRDQKPGLFGKDKFSAGEHKYVTITEGELDAASLYQVLGSPVVSVQSSSSAARDVAVDRSWLNQFERIYLAFDGDAPGREAAAAVARSFDFNKIYQLKFDKYKDANDYLKAGEAEALRQIWWNARKYQPEAIISSFQDFKKILTEPDKPSVLYPFSSLNEMLYGIRTGESVLITAQEGVGKTEVMHAIEYQLLRSTKDAIGAIFIEEPRKRHLQAIAGLELRRPVHLPDCNCSESEVVTALQKAVVEDERLHVYSHFGSDDPNAILDTIRFLVSARQCRYILFDHISMAVSGLQGEDERRALDYLSSRLEMLVVELDFALIMVSHVNDLGQTRGSRYISKIANIRIDISRDHLNPDPAVANLTTVVIAKNRFSGKTGPCCKLLFDPVTYTYKEVENDVWKPSPGTSITTSSSFSAQSDPSRAA
jgi:twinkle protein